MSQPFLPPGGMPPRLRIALDAIRHGRAVVLLDDDDRENERSEERRVGKECA